MKDNLIIQSLDTLKRFDADFEDQIGEKGLDEMGELVEKLTELCGVPGSGNAAIATRNGGVELLCSMCSKVRSGRERFLISALKTLASLLHGTTVIVDAFCWCSICIRQKYYKLSYWSLFCPGTPHCLYDIQLRWCSNMFY